MRAARAIYEEMASVIAQAAQDRDIYGVPRAADRLGLSGGEVRRGLSQRWEYTYADSNGGKVKVICYWYDQSKPFSIRPDMHKMSVELEDAAGIEAMSESYEE